MSYPIEKLECTKCSKLVRDNENSICCDLCNNWFHSRCSLLDKKQFNSLVVNSDECWLCKFCITKSFAFQSQSDNELKNMLTHTTKGNEDLLSKLTNPHSGMKRKCNICNRKVPDISKSLPCVDCDSLIHIRCSRLQLWNLSDILKLLKEWCCPNCWCDRFPFSTIDNNDLIELTFNSNFSCRCQIVNTESFYYHYLERLTLCKIDSKESEPLFNNDIDTYATFILILIIILLINSIN